MTTNEEDLKQTLESISRISEKIKQYQEDKIKQFKDINKNADDLGKQIQELSENDHDRLRKLTMQNLMNNFISRLENDSNDSQKPIESLMIKIKKRFFLDGYENPDQILNELIPFFNDITFTDFNNDKLQDILSSPSVLKWREYLLQKIQSLPPFNLPLKKMVINYLEIIGQFTIESKKSNSERYPIFL